MSKRRAVFGCLENMYQTASVCFFADMDSCFSLQRLFNLSVFVLIAKDLMVLVRRKVDSS